MVWQRAVQQNCGFRYELEWRGCLQLLLSLGVGVREVAPVGAGSELLGLAVARKLRLLCIGRTARRLGDRHDANGTQQLDHRGGGRAMRFEVFGEISAVETIASGTGIRCLADLRKRHGNGFWRKRKGIATVRLADGTVARAEVHWYEANGIGRVDLKIKEWL